MESISLQKLNGEFRLELAERILPFWQGLRDEERGGFYGFVSPSLEVQKNAEKGCILNSRILWFFSCAYKLLGDKNILSSAEHAWRFLRDFCMDKENGGVFWSLSAQGSPLDKTKHTYNQAFAIYALSNYYEASGCEEALDAAKSIFNTIEEKCCDSEGYLEAFTQDFLPASNEKLSENGVMAARTMNTTLHVLEAYTDFFRVTGDGRAKEKLKFILNLIAKKIWNEKLLRQEVFFDSHFNSIIDLHSYGHDIESSWLIDRALEVLKDADLSETLSPITMKMAQKIYERAFKNRSLLNECERGVDNTIRVWWVQAEAVVGFFNAFQKSRDQKFLDAAASVWGYIKEFVLDGRAGGEWFWGVDESGLPLKEKPVVEPWKCPYHNGRMCIEMILRTQDFASKS